MMIRRLEHYNIRTTKYEETVKFYDDILGMKVQRAPMAPADFLPTWIYDDSGVAAIHLTPVDPKDPHGSYKQMSKYRGYDPEATFQGSGAIDHVAFECEGYDEVLERVKGKKLEYAETSFPQANLRQIFIKDPNGVTLELNFR